MLGHVHNLKHKAILYLTYSSGLRVSEVVRLKPGDIDVDRYLVKVRQAKGRKDRYTILSQSALDVLQKFIEQHTPQKWLFPGQTTEKHITERTVQKVFEQALLQSNLQKKASLHTLRHSFCDPFARSRHGLALHSGATGAREQSTIYTRYSKRCTENTKSAGHVG
ncbi:tyrosine-type recombinase/integrase [Paenibacillus sp. FSL M8-0142]|uniref:tyrosine-type recombinase/integrase n=1 Tax=Paenibacillus sp. FSL M8-0142 TaxID=2954525 RepID=UPI00315ABB72